MRETPAAGTPGKKAREATPARPGRSRARATRGPDQRFFDTWSLFYDVPWVQHMTYRPIHDAAVQVAKELAPSRLIDVGCGTGMLTTRLRRELPGSEVVGCDYSPGMLAQARRRGRHMPWVRGNALALPFDSGCTEALVCTEAFHWFPDQQAALEEFFRVLAPGGHLLLALANAALPLLSEVTRIGSRWLGEPLYWPTRRSLRTSLQQAGFEIESQRRVLRLPAPVAFPTFLTVAIRPELRGPLGPQTTSEGLA